MPGNNWVENRIRPIALGRQNWLFAGSLRAGKRAAAVMSLIHSAKLNGLDPYAYPGTQCSGLQAPGNFDRSLTCLPNRPCSGDTRTGSTSRRKKARSCRASLGTKR